MVNRKQVFLAALYLQGMNLRRDLDVAISNQQLSADGLMRLQSRKIGHVLQGAARLNGPYRDLVRVKTGIDLEASPLISLALLPVMSKDDLAEIASAVRTHRRFLGPVVKRTSGSSGRPLELWKQRSGLSQELAVTWRSYGWYGIQLGVKNVRVWGRPLDWRKRARNGIKNLIFNSINISAFDVTELTLAHRMKQIIASKPVFVYGYASALRDLAEFALAHQLTLPTTVLAVISTAEPLDLRTRQVIESAFSVPCRDEYGCSEVGSIAHECVAGRLHLMSDNLVAEVLGDDGTIRANGFGELLVTDLTNELTPVIRYRVGDYCDLDPAPNCPCGLLFPVVSNILGRIEDTVITTDGTRHHPAKICYLVDKIDSAFGLIKQYQVIQKSPGLFEIRLVTDGEPQLANFEAVANRVFCDAFNENVKVNITRVPEIKRDPSGKFRIVKSAANTGGSSGLK